MNFYHYFLRAVRFPKYLHDLKDVMYELQKIHIFLEKWLIAK